MKSDFILL